MVNEGSNFADFVRFHLHIYARTQQSLQQINVNFDVKEILLNPRRYLHAESKHRGYLHACAY